MPIIIERPYIERPYTPRRFWESPVWCDGQSGGATLSLISNQTGS